MNGLLNIISGNNYFNYLKSLNFDNANFHIRNSNRYNLPFWINRTVDATTKTLKLVNYNTGTKYNLDSADLVYRSGKGFEFNLNTKIEIEETVSNTRTLEYNYNNNGWNTQHIISVFSTPSNTVLNTVQYYFDSNSDNNASDFVIDIFAGTPTTGLILGLQSAELLNTPLYRFQNLTGIKSQKVTYNLNASLSAGNYFLVIYHKTGAFLSKKTTSLYNTNNTFGTGKRSTISGGNVLISADTFTSSIFKTVDSYEYTQLIEPDNGIYYYEASLDGNIYKSELFNVCSYNQIVENDYILTSNSNLEIIKNSDLFNYQKFLNFDNSALHLQKSYNKHLPFNFSTNGVDKGAVIGFKIVNKNTGAETILDSSKVYRQSYDYFFLGDITWNLSDGVYYYVITLFSEIVKSELFCVKNVSVYEESFYIIDNELNYITDDLGNKITYIL